MPSDVGKPARNWGRIAIVAGGVLLACVAVVVWKSDPADEEATSRGFGDYDFTDKARIYYGRATLARRPAVVNSSRVYARIPEYIQIKRDGVSHNKPQYHLLMQKASKRFTRAVTAAARARRHDVVAEVGTIEVLDSDLAKPPDLTDDVVRHLR